MIKYENSESYINDEEGLNKVNSEMQYEYCRSNSIKGKVDEDSERDKELKYSKHRLLIIEAIIKLCRNVKLLRKICIEIDMMIKKFNKNGELNCFEGKDYVFEIFEDWISGKRYWDIEKYPDIGKQIRFIVKSKIINDVKKKSNLPKEKYIYGNCNDIPEVNKLVNYAGEEYEEKESQLKRMEEVISEMSKNDQLLYMEYINGKSPKEIAEYFKIPVSEVKNWHKRILRKLKKNKDYIKQSD
jgi:RNA polymerase sigma factor (sigma-70 family)